MSYENNVSLASLDELVQAAHAYLAATITKCDAPEIRQARTALIKALVEPDMVCHQIKKNIHVVVKSPED
jgi:hypothetical protein